MIPAPGNEAAYVHYLTMLHWHLDGRRTMRLLAALFFIVAGFDFAMWVATGSVPFAFGAGFAVAVAVAGLFSEHHHGKKVAKWQARLDKVTL